MIGKICCSQIFELFLPGRFPACASAAEFYPPSANHGGQVVAIQPGRHLTSAACSSPGMLVPDVSTLGIFVLWCGHWARGELSYI